MATFAALPCSVAIRWIIVFHPLVAGLALYGFLRSEGLSRTASTVGGLSLALALADSAFAEYLPFAAMFAWTAVLLWMASRLLRSSRWSSRTVWLIGAALAWGQLAAAHLSQGLIVGTGVLVSYVAIRLVVRLWRKERSTKEALALGGLMLIVLPLVNLAFFLPRISYLPETTLGRGYRTLQILRYQLGGSPRPPFALGGNAPTFPLSLSAAGGAHLVTRTHRWISDRIARRTMTCSDAFLPPRRGIFDDEPTQPTFFYSGLRNQSSSTPTSAIHSRPGVGLRVRVPASLAG